jgi:hypothetical protein
LWVAVVVMGFLLHAETVDDSLFILEEKLTNSGPFIQSTRKHSIYPSFSALNFIPLHTDMNLGPRYRTKLH